MKAFVQSALSRIEAAIDFINGVDGAAYQPNSLSSAELSAIHQTMVR